MNAFMKRLERIRASLEGKQTPTVTLIWESGERRSMPCLEAMLLIPGTPGIVAAEASDETTHTLLNAMLPSGWDFSELEELGKQ